MSLSKRKPLHPAWMLGAGTVLWLLEIAAILYLHLVRGEFDSVHQWQSWTFIVVLHLLTAIWFGLMWPRVLRWRLRKNPRVSPEVRAERERIAQDLHDGVSGHLVNALALLDTPQPDVQQVRNAVEQAMFTLRVEMEALDDLDSTLIERLSSMRWRLQPLLRARGMTMQWEMPLKEVDSSPRAETGRQLAFLVQEAVSNALQHSGGKKIRIQLQTMPNNEWILEISDDGIGIDSVRPISGDRDVKLLRGWGVEGMRSRALRIGAEFCFDSSPGQGTCVRVAWRAESTSLS